MKFIGITERGDAGLDLSWANLNKEKFDGIVLITKNATKQFQEKVFELINSGFKNIIIHFTCTGCGNTKIEPFVPSPTEQLKRMHVMIDNGFPVSHCVLRIDPIIPTEEGIRKFHSVMKSDFVKNNPTLRIRISILDKYEHIRGDLNRILHTSYDESSFFPSNSEIQLVKNALEQYPERIFETCAEKYLTQRTANCVAVGCISRKDYEIFGIDPESVDQSAYTRNQCLCLASKKELLKNKKKCPHQCVYCYWKG